MESASVTPTTFNNTTTTNLESMLPTHTEQKQQKQQHQKQESTLKSELNETTIVTQLQDEPSILKIEMPLNSTFITSQRRVHPSEEGLDAITLDEIEEKVKQFIMATQRKPVYRREIIPIRPPGKIRRVVRRLPTPTPDTIERVHVFKPQADYVDVLIEKPATPAPVVVEKNLVEKAEKPVVNHRVIRVQSRGHSQIRLISNNSQMPSLYQSQSAYQSFLPSYGYTSIVPQFHY